MKTYTHFLTLCIALLFPLVAQSALLDLQDKPVSSAPKPNIMLLFDNDSQISDIDLLPYRQYWNNEYYDPMCSGTYRSTVYTGLGNNPTLQIPSIRICDNGGDVYYDAVFSADSSKSKIDLGSWSFDLRPRSSDFNLLFYNPDLTYTPWPTDCSPSTPCPNAVFTAARQNPYSGTPGYTFTQNLTLGGSPPGGTYAVLQDNRGFTGSKPTSGSSTNYNTTPNDQFDIWDGLSYIRLMATSMYYGKRNLTSTAGTTRPPGGLSGSIVPTVTQYSTAGACFNALGPKSLVGSIFAGTLTANSTDAAGCRTAVDAAQNYANWYQYYRTASFVQKSMIIYILNQYPNFNYGWTTLSRGLNDILAPIGSGNAAVLNSALSATATQSNALSLYNSLWQVGSYYQNGTGNGGVSPIQSACQQNYVIVFPMGFNNPSLGTTVGNLDGDALTGTSADVAQYFYQTDLAPALSNNVIPSTQDPATWQHMVTYGVCFDRDHRLGTLIDTDGDGWPDPVLTSSGNWGKIQCDDLWHASFNSKGKFYSPRTIPEMQATFSAILDDISQRDSANVAQAPVAPVSQNSSVLSATSAIYQPSYNPLYWSGDVKAYSISTTGVLSSTPTYSANCLLTGGTCTSPAGTNTAPVPSNRVVITRDWNSNAGIAFTFPANYTVNKTHTNMINLMKYAPYPVSTSTAAEITANQAYGTALVNYIRGDRTQEPTGSTYDFRDRTGGILGDIIDSSPIYVGPPSRGYPDTIESVTYSSFKTSKASRTKMLYVGANDGMLHGFDATTGVEKLAYVPGARQIYEKLPELSKAGHKFFVNATPAEGDAFYSGAWHTILATTLGNGGQSLSILDITDPANFTAANAANIYRSEFDDTNDADLGYVQGTPIIAKVRNGATSKWAIIMNNGYNNSEADGYASTTGTAALYILFLESGLTSGWTADSTFIKIPVGTGSVATPNGLSTPFAIDTDGDNVVDYVYAGDLQGNMWRFNLTSTTPTAWKTAATTLYTASFSAAGDQPITSAPYVKAHPTGIANGLMVYFGTGKYLEPTDVTQTGQVTQAFYGIWDQMAGATVAESKLLQQQILGTATVGSNSFRLVTNNSIIWTAGATQNLGWYINLIDTSVGANKGERVVSAPLYRNGNIVFSTLIPNSDPCLSPSSWLMELDAANGGRPSATPFDVNNDGVFGTPDYITVGAVTGPASGILPTFGAFLMPTVFTTTDLSKEVKVLNGTGGMGTVNENPGGVAPSSGRRSWRQLN